MLAATWSDVRLLAFGEDGPESNFRWGKRTCILVMVPRHCVAFAEHTDFNHDGLFEITNGIDNYDWDEAACWSRDRAHPRARQ